jgi:hypothetical protein
MQTSVRVLAIAHGNIKLMENAPTAGNTLHAEPLEAYTRSHVMCLIVIASTSVNLNNILRHASKNTLSETSYQDPNFSQLANEMCIIIDNAALPKHVLTSLSQERHQM